VIDFRSGEIVSAEALLRWDHPRYGELAPAAFLDPAERSGLIVEIGRWVIEESARQAAAWARRHPGMDLTVWANVSGVQLSRAGLVGVVGTAVVAAGLDPRRFGLEVTETILMQDVAKAVEVLGELQALGVRIALDDFGTGYSSLAYAHTLPIDLLKLDRTFVAGIDRDPNDVAIVTAVATMAHSLGVGMVAEGVERAAQARVLRRLNCDFGQGFYFSRPVPATEFEAMLDSSVPTSSSLAWVPARRRVRRPGQPGSTG
jgi:EAL domain-containing protein (putative c-di-GMP-specific phosphodiesterase class I)